jgi:hypothetical protein
MSLRPILSFTLVWIVGVGILALTGLCVRAQEPANAGKPPAALGPKQGDGVVQAQGKEAPRIATPQERFQQKHAQYAIYATPLHALLADAVPTSKQVWYGNLSDRQAFVPRAYFSNLEGKAEGLTVVFPGDQQRLGSPIADFFAKTRASTEQKVGVTFLNATADARADLIVDSTRVLPTSNGTMLPGPFGLYPSLVPVKGDPYFGAGGRAGLVSEGFSSRLGTILGTTSSDGVFTGAVASIQANTAANGTTQTAQVQLLYAQLLNNVIVGKADSFFSDPDSIPLTVDIAGPNGQIFAQHIVLGYLLPI